MPGRRVVLAIALSCNVGCLGVEYNKVEASAFCGSTPTAEPDPPSCLPQASAICGPSYDDNCCRSPAQPCGMFLRDFDRDSFVDQSNPATVSDFRLDIYEVTVGRFRTFVETEGGTMANPPVAGSGRHASGAGSGWQATFEDGLTADRSELVAALACDPDHATWTDTAENNEDKPINCLTWYEAFAFCAWDGGRLPTEAEWTYVAAGGPVQFVYPWGRDTPTHDLAVWGCDQPGCPPNTPIASVGSRNPEGAGRFGHADLAGNVAEWLLDWKDWSDPTTGYINPCDDCVSVGGASTRAVRGGAFDTDVGVLNDLKVSQPGSERVDTRSARIGVRCARGI